MDAGCHRRVLRLLTRLEARRQTGHNAVVVGVVEEGHALPTRRSHTTGVRVDDTVNGRPPPIVGPASEKIADVDDERAGDARDRHPPIVGWAAYFETARCIVLPKDG